MRYLLLLFVLSIAEFTSAQAFTFPKLSLHGSTIATLIPANWVAIDTAFGDLNHDKLADLVLTLEYKDEINETRAYGSADTEIIKEFQKPRILAVYFKSRNEYIFKLQNNNFILKIMISHVPLTLIRATAQT
ncbi:MAG: hypothetical protein EOO89_24230 [Pedobacter sp.]|nr:MAG: hypothetical protein EOO89_24230 [Pedobacter sp.]